MKFLLAIARLIDALNERIGRAVLWLTLIVVLVSAANAVSRKVLNMSSNAWLELQWYLFGAIFLLAAGYTYLRNEHVRVDVLSARFSTRVQVTIEIVGILFFLLPAAGLVFWLAIPYFYDSWRIQELSSNTGGLIRWPAKLLIPVGFGLLILSGISRLIRCVAFLSGQGPNPLVTTQMKTAEEELAEEIQRQQEARERSANGKVEGR
ncbi:TRAP transporter small permease subunit [Achromobacter sp. F4_2707]|uniref:TRAP transporter small permease subunit n=1 Tax=Achromobacter sp. F4_2707 TaxID=3114286 RepID=UPI0039C72076